MVSLILKDLILLRWISGIRKVEEQTLKWEILPRPDSKCVQEQEGNWHVFDKFIHIASAHPSLTHPLWILFSSDTSSLVPLNPSFIFLRWHFFVCIIIRKLGPKRKVEKYSPDNQAEWVNTSPMCHPRSSIHQNQQENLCISQFTSSTTHLPSSATRLQLKEKKNQTSEPEANRAQPPSFKTR